MLTWQFSLCAKYFSIYYSPKYTIPHIFFIWSQIVMFDESTWSSQRPLFHGIGLVPIGLHLQKGPIILCIFSVFAFSWRMFFVSASFDVGSFYLICLSCAVIRLLLNGTVRFFVWALGIWLVFLWLENNQNKFE